MFARSDGQAQSQSFSEIHSIIPERPAIDEPVVHVVRRMNGTDVPQAEFRTIEAVVLKLIR